MNSTTTPPSLATRDATLSTAVDLLDEHTVLYKTRRQLPLLPCGTNFAVEVRVSCRVEGVRGLEGKPGPVDRV